MANITDPNAIKFSNESARVGASGLLSCYNLGNYAKQVYDDAGGGSGAIANAGIVTIIQNAADKWLATFGFTFEREAEWFLRGAISFIPNNTDQIIDGSPGDGRPMATGAKIVAVLARFTEFVNAVRSSTFSFSDVNRNNMTYYNRTMAPSRRGFVVLTVADAQNFIDMTALLKTNYQANSNQNLNSLLALVANPGV